MLVIAEVAAPRCHVPSVILKNCGDQNLAKLKTKERVGYKNAPVAPPPNAGGRYSISS